MTIDDAFGVAVAPWTPLAWRWLLYLDVMAAYYAALAGALGEPYAAPTPEERRLVANWGERSGVAPWPAPTA